MISGLAGERRFASTIAKQLELLGAITHGDRRATKTQDFSQFDFENKYGTKALKKRKQKTKLSVDPPTNKHESSLEFYEKMDAACKSMRLFELKSANTNPMPKFLNRLLGMRVDVDLQNQLFEYFTNTLNRSIEIAKQDNKYDLGTLGKFIICNKLKSFL